MNRKYGKFREPYASLPDGSFDFCLFPRGLEKEKRMALEAKGWLFIRLKGPVIGAACFSPYGRFAVEAYAHEYGLTLKELFKQDALDLEDFLRRAYAPEDYKDERTYAKRRRKPLAERDTE